MSAMIMGDSQFLKAVKQGDCRLINTLLLKSPDILISNTLDNGASCIYLAAFYNHPNVLRILLNRSPSASVLINTPIKDGTTPLFIAAKKGHLEIVQMIVNGKFNCQINKTSLRNSQITPFHASVQANTIEIAKVLMDAGCDVNKEKNDGQTPLITAILNGNLEMCRFLVNECRVDIKLMDKNGATALEYATRLKRGVDFAGLVGGKSGGSLHGKNVFTSRIGTANSIKSKNLGSGIIVLKSGSIEKLEVHSNLSRNSNRSIIAKNDGENQLLNAETLKEQALATISSESNSKINQSNIELKLSVLKLAAKVQVDLSTCQSKNKPTVKLDTITIQKKLPIIQAETETQSTIDTTLTIGAKIGKGGFGEVYKTMFNGKPAAAKKILVSLITQKSKVQLMKILITEAETMQLMKNDRVVEFFDFDIPTFSLIMEYCNLGGLDCFLLETKKKINWNVKYQIIEDVAAGMSFLHAKSFPDGRPKVDVFHQDLKSANVQLTDSSGSIRAKISDFGMSILRDFYDLQISSDNARGESVVRLNGWTEDYRAPELYDKYAQFTKASDVYAYGIILLELITQISAHSNVKKRYFSLLLQTPILPKSLQLCLGNSLATKPESRYGFSHILEILKADRRNVETFACSGKPGASVFLEMFNDSTEIVLRNRK